MRGFFPGRFQSLIVLFALTALPSMAQVFTVTPEGIEGKYLEFQPTDISLPQAALTTHHREDLLRFLQSEQGFAMRPLPISTLTLHANGKMQPAGSDYAETIRSHGASVKAGERATITDLKIEKDRLVLDFNGGPEHKHKWLRHVSVGSDPNYTVPIVHDDPQTPTGSRVVLIFAHEVPDVTGLQVEALLKPIVDFTVKNPVQAYTDTLPPAIKKAVLDHQVLVGMNTQMVLSTLGQPKDKVRERDGQMPFEEWIYGDPPQPVQFVRINGNRVVRVEIAKVGESPVIRTENEMGDYWNTQPAENTRIVKLGDQNPVDSAAQNAPKAPPTLKNPGEKLPSDKDTTQQTSGPVQFPKDQTNGSSGQQTTQPSSTSTPVPSTSAQKPAAEPAPIHPTMPPENPFRSPAS
jgi:hypothetical protein